AIVNRALWWPIMSADEVEREFHDQVIDESAKTFKDLGITPGDIHDFTYHYLVSSGREAFSNCSDRLADPPNSKGSEAPPTTTSPQQPKRRKEKRKSISTC